MRGTSWGVTGPTGVHRNTAKGTIVSRAYRLAVRAIGAGVLLLAGAATGLAAELRVDVTGLRTAEGGVHVAVYALPERFPKSDGMLAEAIVRAKATGVQAVFTELPAGAYAIAAFHDENGNRKFDQGLFGIPLEGYGFSNNATVLLGPPAFAEAAIKVPPDGTRITIPIGY